MARKIDPKTGLSQSVKGSKDVIFIGDKGFSVRQDLQTEFLRQKSRQRGFSDAFRESIRKEALRRAELERQRQKELQRLAEEKARAELKRRQAESKRTFESRVRKKRKIISRELEKREKIKTESLIRKAIPTQRRPEKFRKKIERKIISEEGKKRLVTFFDNISGGSVTESRLNKREAVLNQDVEKFNNKYGNKTLSEKQNAQAQKEARELEKRKKQIDKEKDDLARSLKTKIGKVVGTVGLFERQTQAQRQKELKQNQEKKKRLEAENKKLEQEKPRGYKFKIFQNNAGIKGANTEIKRIKEGREKRLLTGDLPLGITTVPKGVTAVKFIGKQKITKSGKVVTDIIFKTSRGQVGFAKGVAVTKGAKGNSVVLGRFAKAGVKFPSTKLKIGRKSTFFGVEKILTKPKTFKLKKVVDVIKKGKKIGKIDIITKNIKGFKQAGIGKVAVVKGKKFFKAGKKVKGISVDDFASLSNIFSKKQLSVIVGKSITGKGAKARFIGIIKGQSKVGGGTIFSVSEKQQFTKALQKVVTATSSALAKAETTKGISKVGALAKASDIVVKSIGVKKAKTTTKTIQRVQPQVKTKVTTPQIQKTKKKLSSIGTQKAKTTSKRLTRVKNLQNQLNKQNQKTKQLQKQLQKTRQKQKQKVIQKQLQRQRARLRLIQKQIQVQIGRINPTLVSLRIPRIPRIFIPKLPKGKIRKKKKAQKPQPVFNVYGKVKGKFVKLNVKPLKRNDALSKGAFAVDKTTAKTFKIVSAGKSKSPGKLFKGERNYFNRNKFKLRGVRIKKGKKFKLKNKYIEKRKYGIDTRSEQRGLTIRQLKTRGRRRIKNKALKGRTQARKQRLKQPKRNLKRRAIRTKKTLRTRTRLRRQIATRTLTPTQLRQLRLRNLARGRKSRKAKSSPIRRKTIKRKVKRKVVRKKIKKKTKAQIRQTRLKNLKRARNMKRRKRK